MTTSVAPLSENVVLVNNPLARQALSVMRDERTGPSEMRVQLAKLTLALLPRLAEDLSWMNRDVRTPLGVSSGTYQHRRVTVVPVLRAGLGMLETAMHFFPDVRAGFIWLKRDEETSEAGCIGVNLPKNLQHDHVILSDGMIATGGSSIRAINILKEAGAKDIRQLFVVAALQGLLAIQAAHPDVKLYGPEIDGELDSRNYIVPGLGDLGDRLYGTS